MKYLNPDGTVARSRFESGILRIKRHHFVNLALSRKVVPTYETKRFYKPEDAMEI
jgi:hypothetical protein